MSCCAILYKICLNSYFKIVAERSSMPLSSAYSGSYGTLKEFFNKIRDGQAPAHFTQQLLQDLGFKSKNHRSYIQILKSLGFLSPDGKPTQRYLDYRDHSKSDKIMGKALREAYSDIFLMNENPLSLDRSSVQGKFKSYHNVSDNVAKIMANNFFELLKFADLSESPQENIQPLDEVNYAEVKTSNVNGVQANSLVTGLHYNIQVHLPATKDIEVYNAIFKSLKEHLY